MDIFQKKYGAKEEDDTIVFHKCRRMFCIYKGELKVADANLPYSHAEWFRKEGWITKDNDSLMDEIVRGYVDKDRNIYFYTGYDFRVNEEVEKTFFKYLGQLIDKLDINKRNCRIYGGSKRENGVWKPRKEYKM